MPRAEEIEVEKLLEEGKVTAEEANKLLEAIKGESAELSKPPGRVRLSRRRQRRPGRSLKIRFDKPLQRPAHAILGLLLGGGITALTLLLVLPIVGFAVGLAVGLVLAILVGLPVLVLGGSLASLFAMPLVGLKRKLGIRRRERIGAGEGYGLASPIEHRGDRALVQRFQSEQRRSGDESSGRAGSSQDG